MILTRKIFWNYIQFKRNKFENRYILVIRKALNDQFRELSNKITSDNIRSDFQIETYFLERAVEDLYIEVGKTFARDQYRRIRGKKGHSAYLIKQEDDWSAYMSNYARYQAGKRITSINKNTRDTALKIIREALEIAVAEGLGADETARVIKNTLVEKGVEMNKWRALRIARTEIVTASNIGSILGAKESGYPMVKYWISTYDDRTRDTHRNIEAQNPKSMDEGFRVGAYLMECPGDPDAGPEETINCRCTIAFEVKEL